jgi:hypothetical protein
MFKLTDVNPEACICDVVVCADIFANTDAHLIGIIGPDDGIYS